MGRDVILPAALKGREGQLDIAPGVASGDHIFLTGMTGANADGTMPAAEDQFRNAFAKIKAVLAEAGRDLTDIVEMTTYHVDMQAHFDLFDSVRKDLIQPSLHAWTAVEVAGLRRAGALVEIRVIASRG